MVRTKLALPNTPKVIDLSLAVNTPTVISVLDEVLKHISVEKIVYSQETADVSPSREKEFLDRFDESVIVDIVPHQVFRYEYTKNVKFVIRTGDFTANSNISLVSAYKCILKKGQTGSYKKGHMLS